MLWTETISSLRTAADTITDVARAVDTRSAQLSRQAATTLEAVTESLPDPVYVADTVAEVKTAAQLASIAFACVTLVSVLALAMATVALVKVSER